MKPLKQEISLVRIKLLIFPFSMKFEAKTVYQ
jgi:hypothetical protein